MSTDTRSLYDLWHSEAEAALAAPEGLEILSLWGALQRLNKDHLPARVIQDLGKIVEAHGPSWAPRMVDEIYPQGWIDQCNAVGDRLEDGYLSSAEQDLAATALLTDLDSACCTAWAIAQHGGDSAQLCRELMACTATLQENLPLFHGQAAYARAMIAAWHSDFAAKATQLFCLSGFWRYVARADGRAGGFSETLSI